MPKKSSRRSAFGSDVVDSVRDRPIATAAVAAAAVGAGVFLWSRRNQISDQIAQLSDQISEWSQNFRPGEDTGGFLATDETERGGTTTAQGLSETGGGNASLGARSGGGGTTGSVSGRGRARSTRTSATL
jgi:hypothetical protein